MKKGRKLPNSVSMDEFINLPLMNQHIFNLRNQKGYTQKEVANAIGVTDKTYRSWEKNGTGIEMYNLLSLADFYKVSIDYLLGRSEYTAVENELIGRETGLSDDSINILKWWHQSQEMRNKSKFGLFYRNELEALNALLEHEWKRPYKGMAQTFFSWIWLYLRSATFRNMSDNENHVKLKDTLIDNEWYEADVSGLMETYTLQEITKSLQELKSEH